MKIIVLAVGATRTPFVVDGVNIYLDRLRHYVPTEFVIIPDIKATRAMSPQQQKDLEGERLLASLQPGDYVALLDERGREFSSTELACWIDTRMQQSLKRLVLIIGGPYGFSQAVYARADAKLSLSRLTFTHEMVRLFLTEQLYRAMTIIRGESYHHE